MAVIGAAGNGASGGNDRAWFSDGLYELLAGVVIALSLVALCAAGQHNWTAAVPFFAVWAWLQYHFMDALIWAKQRVVFPRLGIQAPPPWFRGRPGKSLTTLGLSGRSAPAGPPHPVPLWRRSLAFGGAAAGSLLPLAFLPIGEAYVLASVAVATGLWLGAKPIAVPWRLALLVVLWGVVLWRYGPAPSSAAAAALWFGGVCGCAILAGGISLGLFVAAHPARRHSAGGV